MSETPPRTWRKRYRQTLKPPLFRNTSTHVEKTSASYASSAGYRKHLHARGENFGSSGWVRLGLETPPRTWRKPIVAFWLYEIGRNTSTHVEKTLTIHSNKIIRWKHLQARGENQAHTTLKYRQEETPPRTWRKLGTFDCPDYGFRNTSTHVEKTPSGSCIFLSWWKHLHARGENTL